MPPRITGPASEIVASERRCHCCDRTLKGKVAWLELDQRDNTFHDRGGVPPQSSQGWFAFGMACARQHLARATGGTDR